MWNCLKFPEDWVGKHWYRDMCVFMGRSFVANLVPTNVEITKAVILSGNFLSIFTPLGQVVLLSHTVHLQYGIGAHCGIFPGGAVEVNTLDPLSLEE